MKILVRIFFETEMFGTIANVDQTPRAIRDIIEELSTNEAAKF